MQEINHPKGKVYYSMGEVAEMFDVRPSLLRYWEQEFDIIKPHRNKKGNRLFTPEDVDNIKIIYHLLKEKKMKIEVAKRHLKVNKKEISRDTEIVERLMNIRSILLEIKNDLTFEGRVVDEEEPARDEMGSYSEHSKTSRSSRQPDNAAGGRGGLSAFDAKAAAGERSDRPAQLNSKAKPPFEEQTLFEIAVPHIPVPEDIQDDSQSSQQSDGDGYRALDGITGRATIIEQTLF